MMRIGLGYDVHRITNDRPLILGGIRIPADFGLDGHSDADVLTHAIIDALLGAMGWGDIGSWFPDDDPRYKNVDSFELLAKVIRELESRQVKIHNIDSTVIAEKPKLQPHINGMRKRIAEGLNIAKEQISVKATTSEKLGFAGKGEGIAAHCVVLVAKQ